MVVEKVVQVNSDLSKDIYNSLTASGVSTANARKKRIELFNKKLKNLKTSRNKNERL